MRAPNSYPIRSVSEKKYDDDDRLEINDLVQDQPYTLRAITNRKSPENFASDYSVYLEEVVVSNKFLLMLPSSTETINVVFRPISADGIILPNKKIEPILESGALYSMMRLIFHPQFRAAENGYFVASDEIDEEWQNFHLHSEIEPISPRAT